MTTEVSHKTTLKRIAVIELAILGAISASAQILPMIQWQVWTGLFLLCSVSSILIVWRASKPSQLPEEPVLKEDSHDGDCLIEVPVSHEMLHAANKHAKEVFGHDSPSVIEYERWWGRNPFILAVLSSDLRQYLGYFDILPLSRHGLELFLSGDISERTLGPDLILPPVEMKNAKAIYVAGIAVKGCQTSLGKTRAAKMYWGLASYIQHYYGNKRRRVLALAATRLGERALTRVKAKVISHAESRKDHHDLYEFWITPKFLSKIKSRASKRVSPPKLKLQKASSHF